ncbi:MAG: PEGA domain-containing protein [Myxococcales bacterium]|nr:PEGA domain-containing protein [Myxococcales bacterium]
MVRQTDIFGPIFKIMSRALSCMIFLSLWAAPWGTGVVQADVCATINHTAAIDGAPGQDTLEGRWHRALRRCVEERPHRRSAVARLRRAEERIAEARHHALNFDEGQALRALADAEKLVLGSLVLEGAPRWLAEVAMVRGVVAFQAGHQAIAREAFALAVTLDPDRPLRLGETSPAAVALYLDVAREVRSRPFAEFRVTASAPEAVVSLDGQVLGKLPQRLRMRVGRHVLVIGAPEHVSYGATIDVFEGERPSVHVALAPDSAFARASEVAVAQQRGDLVGVVAGLSDFEDEDGLRLRAGFRLTGHRGRFLRWECGAIGCGWPQKTPVDPMVQVGTHEPREVEEFLRSARPWLDATPAPSPWYLRADVWIAAAILVGTVSAAVSLGTATEAGERRRVVVQLP